MAGLNCERLKQLLDYDPETGEFRWRIRTDCDNRRVGTIAGAPNDSRKGRNRRRIRIDGTKYYASRLAWLYVTGRWPTAQIDHKDLDVANNRFTNLREATASESAQNRGTRPRRMGQKKTSRFKGVHWAIAANKWVARVGLNGRQRHLGCFDNEEEAYAAYCAAAAKTHGDFARIW
jgi:hypothetical protein